MKLTQINVIRKLNKKEYFQLRELCFFSNCLYNVGLYKTLCERYAMKYIEQEESYTSKASFLDLDEIPKYDAEKPYTENFSGKRIKRGLYRSKEGKIINADVNGAANILRKSKQNLLKEGLCTGVLATPLRIRLT